MEGPASTPANHAFYETPFKDSFHLGTNTAGTLFNVLGPHIAGTPTHFRMPAPARFAETPSRLPRDGTQNVMNRW